MQDLNPNDVWQYEKGFFKVSRKMIRVFSRTYPIHRVEKIGIRRDPFYIALGVLLPLAGFAIAFNEYLYLIEKIAIYGCAALILAVLSQIGVLYIQAGSSYSAAAVWRMRDLRELHEAIIQVME